MLPHLPFSLSSQLLLCAVCLFISLYLEKAICVSQSGSYLECLWLNKKNLIIHRLMTMMSKAWEKVANSKVVVEIA